VDSFQLLLFSLDRLQKLSLEESAPILLTVALEEGSAGLCEEAIHTMLLQKAKPIGTYRKVQT